MTLADDLAKLPAPSDEPGMRYDCTSGGAQFCQGCYTMTREPEYGDWVRVEDYLHALARLALAREWLADEQTDHRGDCACWAGSEYQCSCGLMALIKAMEAP